MCALLQLLFSSYAVKFPIENPKLTNGSDNSRVSNKGVMVVVVVRGDGDDELCGDGGWMIVESNVL